MNQSSQQKLIVLAFSGGLDTSFCVPYLIEAGYVVHTIFVDSGGISSTDKQQIEKRALSLGAIQHHQVNIGQALWQQVITPMVKAGYWYQNQYPLLCSDRYLIVEACLKLCDQLGTQYFAHGCTGMGNDQVRFDLAVQSLGDYTIISPIREIQKHTQQVREYEKQYLIEKGFDVSDKVSKYSINENLLGATISGSEIDEWQSPGEASYVLTTPPSQVDSVDEFVTIQFLHGEVVAINKNCLDESFTGEHAVQRLNQIGGKLAIGRGIYTGDTTIGLKGRIVFEAPALHCLNIAHTALEQAILSKAQNRFKTQVAQKWTELVYEGFFYDPLKMDLEAFLNSSQKQVSGEVTLLLSNGQAQAVAITSPNILKDKQSIYAQSANWNIEEAQGFIKLFGKSSTMAANQHLIDQSNVNCAEPDASESKLVEKAS
ncbi:argininosuccinate synthase [Aliikangiella marina]|uniref:argininosuccinate synthase n=1 Tax=Aliikangiella marina TaxID=1712262 RepID=A0A545T2L9_9GAMM|nr:argininosuccinate synthase [Aliikangiella marina]TQV71471.1 argininosuccinate synthase [Aliikangiella marina]